MKYNLRQFLERVDGVGGDFGERVRRIVLPNSGNNELYIISTNLVLEKDKNNNYTPHGCDICLGVEVGQNTNGIPTFGAHECIDAWGNGLKDNQLPREAMLNLWFCPKCRVPVMKSMPRFE